MKLAAIQMCSSYDIDTNLATAKLLIAKAATNGAKLVVLPEMFAIMGMDQQAKIQVKENFGGGKIQDFLSHMASEHDIWLVGGTIPLACDEPNKVRAACLIYDETGQVVARYDKIHLFDVNVSDQEGYQESATIQAGEDGIVVDTPLGKLGIAVCFDIRFPDMFTQMASLGAEIIAIPSAFTVPTGEAHWELLVRARAIDSFCYIVGACQGGTHPNGRKTWGHSVIVNPWGQIIAEQKETVLGVIEAELDLTELHRIRKAIPIL